MLRKPLVWLHGEVKTPPFSAAARVEAGLQLRRLQDGDFIGLPHSRPMPSIGGGCAELRIVDRGVSWRIVYRVVDEAIVILAVFAKKSATTPRNVLETCRRRLKDYDDA